MQNYISKDKLVSQVITATLSCIKKVIDLEVENINVDHLKEGILKWHDLRNSTLGHSDDRDAREDEDEMAMTRFTFNDKCYNCGKDGHHAKNCKERKNDRARKRRISFVL